VNSATKPSATKLRITLPEYSRIYEVIYSVLEGRANTPHACMFFAIAGAFILKEHYKIPARPVAGGFLLCVDSTPSVISIAKHEDGTITSDLDGFHMWVQTETHVIDFMAPIFNESIKGKGLLSSVPRKMFQRPLPAEVESIDRLSAAGDYFTLPNIELTNERLQSFMDRPSHMDLLEAANRWFKKHPKKLDDLSLLNDLGEVAKLTLRAPKVSGAW
jgi:hypothetical protein